MMKKLLYPAFAAFLAVALAACGGGQNQSASSNQQQTSGDAADAKKDDFPNKAINLIVSYAAGGGTDVGARILAPFVEKELGVPINVINKPGGGGWVGWTELATADPDGYTIGYINSPNLMTGYLDPKQNREHNLDSFALIANHIKDPGAIAIRVDEKRFTNINELVEFAKQNKVTATSTGVGSDDHLAALKLNDKFGTQFTSVHNGGAAEGLAAVMGGHVDVLFANVSEVAEQHQNNEIKVIAVMSEERSPYLSDVPSLAESGFAGVTSSAARGIAAPKGIDPQRLEILRAAFEKGIKNGEQIMKQEEASLQVDYMDGEEYLKMLKRDEQEIIGLRELLGW